MIKNMKAKEQVKQPQVGDGATLVYYTDRHAATIVRISDSGKTIWVREDVATRIDNNGMSECQDYSYTPNPDGKLHKATRRKNGNYKVSNSSILVAIGVRRSYHDYSF